MFLLTTPTHKLYKFCIFIPTFYCDTVFMSPMKINSQIYNAVTTLLLFQSIMTFEQRTRQIRIFLVTLIIEKLMLSLH